jgi:hypothetical protein
LRNFHKGYNIIPPFFSDLKEFRFFAGIIEKKILKSIIDDWGYYFKGIFTCVRAEANA